MHKLLCMVKPLVLLEFHLAGNFFFSLEGKLHGVKGLPNLATQQMSPFFENVIQQGSRLVFIDDILPMSNSKPHMLQLIKNIHELTRRKHLEFFSEKPIFMFLTVKCSGQKIGFNTSKPIRSKIAAIHLNFFRLEKVNWWRSLAKRSFSLKFLINVTSIWSLSFFCSMILSVFTELLNWKHCFNILENI